MLCEFVSFVGEQNKEERYTGKVMLQKILLSGKESLVMRPTLEQSEADNFWLFLLSSNRRSLHRLNVSNGRIIPVSLGSHETYAT